MRVVNVGRVAVAYAVAVLLVGVSGCIGAPTSPTITPAFSKVDLTVGTGDEAVSGSTVTVNYTGWLYDPTKPDFKGAQFDTSLATEPFTFALGTGAVIKGWDLGIVGMKVGGVRRLVVPPAYGYGGTRVSAIPAEATILFDVELLSIQ